MEFLVFPLTMGSWPHQEVSSLGVSRWWDSGQQARTGWAMSNWGSGRLLKATLQTFHFWDSHVLVLMYYHCSLTMNLYLLPSFLLGEERKPYHKLGMASLLQQLGEESSKAVPSRQIWFTTTVPFVLIFGGKWDMMRHKETLFLKGGFHFFNHL